MRKIIVFIILLFHFNGFLAQEKPTQDFEIAVKKTGNDLRVKVFPRSVAAFESYRHNGLHCEIKVGDGSIQKFKLHPASNEEWESSSDSNKKVGAAFDMLHKKSADSQPKTIEEKVKADKILHYSHGFFLVLSCMDQEASKLSGLEISVPHFNSAFTIDVMSQHNDKLNFNWTLNSNDLQYNENSPDLVGFNHDHAIKIAWDHEDYFHQVMSYVIQEQNAKGAFEDLPIPNKIYTTQEQSDPILAYKMMHIDSLSQNYVNHTYRIIGVDAFGDRMKPSNVVTLHGRDLTPPEIPTKFSAKFENNKANLTWDIPNTDVDRILILRSETGEEGPFDQRHEDFLNNKTNSFVDEIEDPEKIYFYILLAADTAGNVSKSYPQYLDIPDIYPPNVPLDLKANVDSLGQVILYWHHNDNDDLRGYKVFRSERENQEFIQVSKGAINSNIFYDQLNLKKHNPKTRYYVRAIDKSYNHSISTDTVTVLRPDTISPSAPILRKAIIENNKVNLAWIPSSSNDVSNYLIMVDTGTGWWEQNRCSPETYQYSTSLLDNHSAISYKITAEDEMGNQSKNEAGKRVFISEDQEKVLDFELSSDNEMISISWGEISSIKSVMIYRSKDGEKFLMLRKLDADAKTYTDKSVIKGQKYQYKIAKENSNGTRSEMSVAQEIKVK